MRHQRVSDGGVAVGLLGVVADHEPLSPRTVVGVAVRGSSSSGCTGRLRAGWDLAQSAYVADLDADPDSPASLAGWLGRALEQHAGRSPAERAAAGEQLPERSPGRGTSRGHRVGQAVIDPVEQAIVVDRRELGRVVSRSGFVLEAVAAAAWQGPPPARPPLPPRHGS